MAKAQSSVSKRHIENVRIVHSEENLEPVVRRLAVGLEEHLKLPGQADYDREAASGPDYVINQLKKVYDMNVPTVLYISDDLLKIFKKKKKQVDMLKNVLQKDAEAQAAMKNIVILWGELKDKDLVKKVFGIDYNKIQKGQLSDLQLANFSLNEVGNIVEAVLKLWSGPDAQLPKPTHDTEIEVLDKDTCGSMDPGLCQTLLDKDTCGSMDPGLCQTRDEISAQPGALHVCVIHFDHKDLRFVNEVAFHLMAFMKLQKSVDFFTFYVEDDAEMISKSLAQLKELQKSNEKAVVILNKHLMNLFKSDCEAVAKFESLCLTAVEQTNNVVFLLKNISLDDVKECSESLTAVISKKCNVYKEELEDKNHIETAVFSLTRFLRDGAAIENDESTMVRPMKEEYADYKRNVVGSNGESISAKLLEPMPGLPSGTAMSSKDQAAGHSNNENSKDFVRHIVTSNGESLHIKGMEQSTDKDFNHVPSNNCQSDGQSRRTTESLQQHAAVNTVNSERTVSKLDGFSGYYEQHQMHHQSHSDTLFTQSLCSSSKTVQEQPNQNGFSPVSGGGDIPLSPQSKPPISSENDKDGPLALRSRATTDSSHQDQSTQQFAASNTNDNRVLKKLPHIQQVHPSSAVVHERKSEPTYAPATPTQYRGTPPSLPESYSQRNTQPVHMQQHPVSQQSVSPANYGVQPRMFMPGNHTFTQTGIHQAPVMGQGPYGFYSPDSSARGQHQSHTRSAAPLITEETLALLRSNPEFINQFQRLMSLQTQPTGVPEQPASAQQGELPRRSVLHASRSVPNMAGSNLAVPMNTRPGVFLLNLDTELKHKIGIKLNSTKVCGYYWKHFAEAMGVSHDVIRNWESIQCNYMDKLFEWLGTNNEEYTVSDFKGLATRFERPDIVKLLCHAGH